MLEQINYEPTNHSLVRLPTGNYPNKKKILIQRDNLKELEGQNNYQKRNQLERATRRTISNEPSF